MDYNYCMGEKLFTTNEAAEILGRKRISVQLLAKRHGIGQKIGRDYLLTKEDIDRLRGLQGAGRPTGSKDSYPRTVTNRPKKTK